MTKVVSLITRLLSLHTLAYALESIAVIVSMLLFEVESGSEPGGAIAAGPLIHTFALQFESQRVADGGRLARERQEGAHAAHFLYISWVLLLDLKQAVLKVLSSPCCNLIKSVLFDDFVLGSCELSTNGISKERVKVAIPLLHSSIVPVVETA